ncbi:3'-5' exoribonuclease HELZ2-like [Trichomycterus rosablanca]|uniref:3'-5' exoribonuclease HELZ2-like n=1 Tax=Trichomycterus rosablanca TaxID=2290929 RepID=UPI002F3539FD
MIFGMTWNAAGTMNITDFQELLITHPHEYKHCKLKLKRPDLAYARPLDEPNKVIKISGVDDVGKSLPGDEVCVQILSRELHQEEELLTGRVVRLLSRTENMMFLCRMKTNNQQLVTPLRENMSHIKIFQKTPKKIDVRRFNQGCKLWLPDSSTDIAEDQLLMVKVLKWENNHKYPLGVVTKVISQHDRWKEMLEVEFGVTGKPPAVQFKKGENDKDDGMDFRNETTFTIDPDDAQDLDDAISVTDKGDTYEIAIHITDVASYVKINSKEDEFAKKQGRTFYPPHGEKEDPAFMFSRELSSKYLSLVPDQDRRAISLITVTDKSFIIQDSYLTLSLIRSDERLSYRKADKIIQECCLDNKEPRDFIADPRVEECIAVVYRFTEVHRRCRLQGSWSSGQMKGDSRAHCMVEELMNLYNSQVAEMLLDSDLTRDLTLLKCHLKPKSELLENFKQQYSALLPLSLHLSSSPHVCGSEDSRHGQELEINVIAPIFEQMEALAESGKYHSLLYFILSDDIHPTLRPMAKQFIEIQEKARILRSSSTWSSRLGHFGLQLNAYTCASSPMRRYLDLILQRLLHAVLQEKRELEYDKNNIEEFCEYGMDKSDCAKYYDLDEKVKFTKSSSRVVTKLAIVERPDPKQHEFRISLPLDRVPEIPIMYRDLKVVEQPEYSAERESVTLQWKRRVYSFTGAHKPRPKSKLSRNVVSISATIWKEMISAVKDENWTEVTNCIRRARKAADKKPDVPPTDAHPESIEHFKNWTLELKLGEVLQVQPGRDVVNKMTVPTVNLLNISPSFEVCVEHARNRIKCFSTVHDDCEKSKTSYKNVQEYQKIWSKLCKMDTVYNAVEENNSVILEDVSITWKDRTKLKGYLQMTQTQKKEWSLEFDLTNCFLCIRLKIKSDEVQEETERDESGDYGLPDLQRALPFTWVAHGIPVMSGEEREKNKNQEQPIIKIHFQVNDQNMDDIPPRVYEKDTKFTVEVIPKKIPYMLHENAVARLKRANTLVKNIATGTLPQENLIREDKDLAPLDPSFGLPTLNKSQKKAVQDALQNPFTVIQGPPGTGKTVVGVNIAYQFYMKNKLAEKERPEPPKSSADEKKPKKYGILYCGPSNKSVDTVAEQLLKLKRVLKPLRIYCDQMEMRAFPYPGSDLKLCRKSFRDEEPKEELKEISLMYLVRKPDNPSSEEIKDFEKGGTEFDSERYRKVLREAQVHELRKHDVILCTCSTALKPILKENMDFRQIIIDECAMATEPEAFIPLVSHNPEQIVLLGDHKQIRPIVSCARVKELGMEMSLFERYMAQAVMLDMQYRMHESICEFPSNEFYDGKLRTGPKKRPRDLLNEENAPTAILFAHVEGKEVSLAVSTKDGNENSVSNKEEAEQAVRVAELLIRDSCVKPEDIAILTPYNTQIFTIKKILEEKKAKCRGIEGISVCTIMKSQGSEWPYVIISTVRSCPREEIPKAANPWMMRKKLGFVTDPNQVNVAVTRAQQGLCILGNRDLLKCDKLWYKLLNHYQKENCVLNSADLIKVQKVRKR